MKCKICNGSGTLEIANDSEYDEGFCDCGNCEGTGVDLQKKETVNSLTPLRNEKIWVCKFTHDVHCEPRECSNFRNGNCDIDGKSCDGEEYISRKISDAKSKNVGVDEVFKIIDEMIYSNEDIDKLKGCGPLICTMNVTNDILNLLKKKILKIST
jgi:hypothetical protein